MASHRGTQQNSLPEEVRQAALRGWPILPVIAGNKGALVKEWQKVATCDVARLEAWAAQYPGCNWGAATGPASGFFVLDIDGDPGTASVCEWGQEGKVLPRTRIHRTARGSHLFFNWPADIDIRNSASKIAPGIDIRGNLGYVVVSPSIHRSGTPYTCLDKSVPIADCPQFLLEKIQQSAQPVLVTLNKAASCIGPGDRTPILFSTAGKLRSLGVPAASIEHTLLALNSTLSPPHCEEKVRRIAAGIERYPPDHNAGTRIPDIVCLSDVKALPVPWIWKGYLAFGMLAMLSGDPDAGKTFIALAIAAELSNGRLPESGDPCAPITTLYLSRENAAEYVLRPRFDALGGNPYQISSSERKRA